jgi:hypothetical protein
MSWRWIEISTSTWMVEGCRRYVASPPADSKARNVPSRGFVPRADYLRSLIELVHRPGGLIAHVLEDLSVPPQSHRRVGVVKRRGDGEERHALADVRHSPTSLRKHFRERITENRRVGPSRKPDSALSRLMGVRMSDDVG